MVMNKDQSEIIEGFVKLNGKLELLVNQSRQRSVNHLRKQQLAGITKRLENSQKTETK